MNEGNEALALVFARNAFYRRMHFLALGGVVLAIFVIGFLFTVLLYLMRNPTEPLYFATDNVGRLINIVPVNVPNMSTDDVATWTINAVTKALSYDFINYAQQFQDSQKYFTDYGWRNYMKAISTSNILPALKQRKWLVVAKLAGPPKLLVQGILSGKYAYKFELPFLVSYISPPYDAKSQFANAFVVSVIVQRQPILQSNQGLGIGQIITSSALPTSTGPQEISATPSG